MLTTQKSGVRNSVLMPESPVELKKLILKLRWIGLENDAILLHARLAELAPGECAGLWPRETD